MCTCPHCHPPDTPAQVETRRDEEVLDRMDLLPFPVHTERGRILAGNVLEYYLVQETYTC